MNFGLHGLLVQQHRVMTVFEVKFMRLINVVATLVTNGDLHLAAPLDIAVNLIAVQGLAEIIHIVAPKLFKLGDLPRKEPLGVVDAVHDRG